MTNKIFLVWNPDLGDQCLLECISKQLSELPAGIDVKHCSYEDLPSFSDNDGNDEKKNNLDCIILSLFSADLKDFAGLRTTRQIRKDKKYFQTPILYLVPFPGLIPHFHKPHKLDVQVVKNLLGKPEFGEVDKAIFFGEVFFKNRSDKEEASQEIDVLNVFSLSLEDTFFQDLVGRIERLQKYNKPEFGDFRKMYHDTFVNFHEFEDANDKLYEIANEDLKVREVQNLECPEGSRIGEFVNQVKKTQVYMKAGSLKVRHVLEFADYIHCLLEGLVIKKKKGGHHIPLELFSAPPPFPLQELYDAVNELGSFYKNTREPAGTNKNGPEPQSTKRIELLLIDNKSDKLKEMGTEANDRPSGLLGILFKRPYEDVFSLNFGICGSGIDKDNKPLEDIDNFCFDFEKFLKGKEKLTNKISSKTSDDSIEYCEKIYGNMKESHFILLDFFLSPDNMYLAFDFIKDIGEIKNIKRDVFTTWYFITSSVYDSVVKFYQSGLLAEYYESAVVSSGDDPTNDNRQIIFIYKLLTFINARINSFKRFHDSILGCRLLSCEEKDCTHKNLQCLSENQNLFRKYLGEYGDIVRIFPGQEEQEEEFKKTVELMDSTVSQFLWLPEADWPMIQRQIDHINLRLKDSGDLIEKQFKCQYIIDEIKKRSEIY